MTMKTNMNMEYCDTFIRDQHIKYIVEVGNDKDSLAAVGLVILRHEQLDCNRTSTNEWSILGIMCTRDFKCRRRNG